MLKTELEKTTNRIKIVLEQNKVRGSNEEIMAKNSQFFDIYDKLILNVKSYMLAKDNFGFVISPLLKERYADLLKTSGENLKNGTVGVKLQKYSNEVNFANGRMGEEWKKFIQPGNFKLNNDLRILSCIYDNKAEINGILAVFTEISKWPLNKDIAEQYSKKRKRAEELINSISLDSEKRSFIIKLSSGSATLLDLNDSIIEWLKSENIMGNISLSIK